MSKKIMFVCNGLGSGGAERVITILANQLIKKDYSIFILAFIKSDQEYELNEKIKVIYEQLSGGVLNKLERVTAIRRYAKLFDINTVVAFSHYINMSAIIAGMFLKAKIIISERNDPAQVNKKKLLSLIRRLLYPKADTLVCQTNDAREYFNFIKKSQVVVIANPIIENLPKPFEGIRSKRIVTFSRIEPQKNIAMVIDAFYEFHKDFNDYMLEIYGQGSLLPAMKEHVSILGLQRHIIFHPFSVDIHRKVVDASMFVLGSDYEGLSNSMLESMAMGLPCIVTDCPCGGARMVITSYENGILVPVRDAQAMYEAMKYVIKNPEQAAYMSKNATKIRSDLAVDKIITEWERVI